MRRKQMKIVNEMPETKEETSIVSWSECGDEANHDEICSQQKNALQDHKD